MTGYIVTSKGDRFFNTKDVFTVKTSLTDYRFDIKDTDIVLDIGANVGGFSIPASRLAYKVYAVEPLMVKELRDNIILNTRNNIEIIENALGDGGIMNIYWRDNSFKDIITNVHTMRLSVLKSYCPDNKCDFLKIDCEGGEWCIKQSEIEDVRRIEMEIHRFKDGEPFSTMYNMLEQAGFIYEYQEWQIMDSDIFDGVSLVHCYKEN